jgi:hypothetical protein
MAIFDERSIDPPSSCCGPSPDIQKKQIGRLLIAEGLFVFSNTGVDEHSVPYSIQLKIGATVLLFTRRHRITLFRC